MKPVAIADALLPGSGLIIDSRSAWGLPLLVPAILLLSALLLALTIGGFASAWVVPRALPSYAALSVAALLFRWRFDRRGRLDPIAARQLARAASQAWLRSEPAAADHALALTRAAPELAPAWRLHALITGDQRSVRRAEAIERR